ncbi:MAG TPA: glycerol-3-phosphate dehydrogenase [Gemmatimonadaceae bacterium]|nr:glycerol-3-phosphate dehydrogenase [Gemmatimonadaceae bacterium]
MSSSVQSAALTQRAQSLANLGSRRFDVLVVGGGITGVGVARDAALRGMNVALVERDDFASGTSSRSSRLVHGGLRYLEHGHLHLVFESSLERRRLLELAPHLVRPLEFIWPVYEGARVPRWKLGAGLFLYDLLALFRNVAPHRRLDPDEVLAREPRLRAEDLTGGASYFDAATDDARLTLATALGAHEAGATVANHAGVRRLLVTRGRTGGAIVADSIGGSEVSVRARIVVNAAGPWSDEIRRLDEPTARATLRGTKGVHVTVPRDRIGNHNALTLLSPVDGRVMFLLPGDTHAVIGTTDTETDASPDDVRASRDDVDYLLRTANHFFPAASLTAEDVVCAWAGIRPLVAGRFGTDAAAASREHEITVSERGVVSVSGGKLTTYRAMSAEVVDVVERELGRVATPSETARVPLPGGDFDSFEQEVERALRTLGGSVTSGMTGVAEHAEQLVRAYGSRWKAVWAPVRDDPSLAEPLVAGLPYMRAEVAYAVSDEMAVTLADALVRRTHVAFESRDHGRGAAPIAADIAGERLGWDLVARQRAVTAFERETHRLFDIDESSS